MPPKNARTSAQKKVLKDSAANLDRAYADALANLAAAGIEGEEGTSCKKTPSGHCRSFKQPKRGNRCARPGCNHLFSDHHLPT
jgi:hypothetical protein